MPDPSYWRPSKERKPYSQPSKERPTVFGSKRPKESQKSKDAITSEPLSEKELKEFSSGIMKHPAFALYKWPKVSEISKQENPVAAWLAEATAYIALHLQPYNSFMLEISNENLESLKRIHKTFIDIQNYLPSVLSNYENRYNQVYRPFQETLQNFDAIADTPAKRAGIFLERARDFFNLILTIHSETLRRYGKAEQTLAKGNAGDTTNTHKPVLSDFKDVEQAIIKQIGKNKIKYQQIIRGSGYNDGGHIKSAIQNLKKVAIIKHERPFYSLYPQHYYLLKSKK